MVQNNQKTSWKYLASLTSLPYLPIQHMSLFLSLQGPSQDNCSCSLTVHSFSSSPAVRKQQTWFPWHLKDSTLRKSPKKMRKRHRVISSCCSPSPHLPIELLLNESRTSFVLIHGFLLNVCFRIKQWGKRGTEGLWKRLRESIAKKREELLLFFLWQTQEEAFLSNSLS